MSRPGLLRRRGDEECSLDGSQGQGLPPEDAGAMRRSYLPGRSLSRCRVRGSLAGCSGHVSSTRPGTSTSYALQRLCILGLGSGWGGVSEGSTPKLHAVSPGLFLGHWKRGASWEFIFLRAFIQTRSG